MNSYTHWQLKIDDAGIAWLTLDSPGEKPNTLSSEVFAELQLLVDELDINLPKALVLRSGKAGGFIAGAEISEFEQIKTQASAEEHIGFVHSLFNRIETLPIPRVALIHGFCLGAGLELALTFDYLLAADEPDCKLGLPEVRLGIHPGYGGTVRLIERIGAPKAMELMLGGRVINSRAANKLGLLDELIPRRQFRAAVRDYIRRAPATRRAPVWLKWSFKYAWPRRGLAAYMRKQLSSRASPIHYPAPYALLELWRNNGGNRETMLAEEIRSVARLVVTDTAQNLVRLFFLQENLKTIGKAGDTEPIKHLHVIGAGVMGGDIAAWSVLQGLRVTIEDQSNESIGRTIARARTLFEKKLKTRSRVQAAMDSLIPDPNGEGVAVADMIIEAIFENLDAKQMVFTNVEARARPEAILASNTSSIPIENIAAGLQAPERLVGIHFFNPVAKMQLVELVRGAASSTSAVAVANAYILQINRLPITVRSSPGFLVNRVLMPYLVEAVTMLDEGVAATQIDRAAEAFGMPVGPIELADVVGLDICLHVAQNLLDEQGVPASLKRLVEADHKGRKSGQGFYPWIKGKAEKPDAAESTDEKALAERMLYPLLNECVACLHEEVVASAEELDAGVVFGTGFAPFTAGPTQLLRSQGREKTLNTLQQLHALHGERFRPADGWDDPQIF